MADWHIGQKVVCVDAKWPCPEVIAFYSTSLVRGKIYTIRNIRPLDDGVIGVCLEEIVGKMWTDEIEYDFHAWRFRPVVLSESDISIFTKILDRVNKRGKVDA